MQFKEGIDYNYVIPENESTTVGIKLLTGPFRDVVYQYGKVKFEEGANDDIYLGFIYNVIESPYEKDYLNEKFKNYIGDILVEIMSQNIEKGLLDEAGTDYIEDSDTK